jgi:hypothetical protein
VSLLTVSRKTGLSFASGPDKKLTVERVRITGLESGDTALESRSIDPNPPRLDAAIEPCEIGHVPNAVRERIPRPRPPAATIEKPVTVGGRIGRCDDGHIIGPSILRSVVGLAEPRVGGVLRFAAGIEAYGRLLDRARSNRKTC